MTTTNIADDRNETIKEIRAALKRRSGHTWSVRGGTGTAWGWISINVPPAQQNKFGGMNPEQAAELANLLDLPDAHWQGVSIPASGAYRQEYIDRANGRTPSRAGTPYWD